MNMSSISCCFHQHQKGWQNEPFSSSLKLSPTCLLAAHHPCISRTPISKNLTTYKQEWHGIEENRRKNIWSMENRIHNQKKREGRRKRKTWNQDNKTNWNADQIRRECNTKKSVRPCNNKVRVKLALIQKWCTKHGDLLLHFTRVDRRRHTSSRSQDLICLKKGKKTWGWALWAPGGSNPQGWPSWPTGPTGQLLHCKSFDTQVQFHKSRGNFTTILPQMGSFRVGPPTPPI